LQYLRHHSRDWGLEMTRHVRTGLALRLLGSIALGVALVAQQPAALAIVNVTVIPMDRERTEPDQTVIVRGDRIEALGPTASVTVPPGARRIEGRGKFLIPTFSEMHAHIPPGNATDAEIARVLTLYAVNGIGTIRGMLGAPKHLPLRDRANRGEILSPWIYTSGPSFNGTSASSAAVAVQMVKDQKAAGYDLLKIHPGVKRDVFDAMATAADAAGIRFAGHVPLDVGLMRALEARYATIDHVDGYVEALAREGAPGSQMFGLNLTAMLDESRIPSLVEATRKAGVWIVPTEALFQHWVGPTEPEAMRAWPEMQYVPKDQMDQWVESKRKLMAGATPAERARFLEVRGRLIKALHAGGVGLLLGSDGPQVWNVPGFSVHRELRYLVQAGLTPYQALETGTRNVAVFFGTAGDRGTVAQGKRADLVLLEGNPLADIGNSARVDAVVLGGRLLTKDDISDHLARLRSAAGGM
jgi:imidazolonepropionase-like amidohydrolase